ncbi:AraC family transcriptional regulator [Flavobacterium sp. KACC 22763]|uniref:AraC family transcriptional regulator n=1 Tax=Flavobacterium sp. KACC 22763 TaxID=3025668 RepID=UPI002365F278|nr:helix-turn-helix domain-containing protein [Flavobacterium sp. KACC 22763]WDF66104.1 helix-turn-helix domain-containing protein [Flavobacterium sp. KACC 22763]
MNRPNLLLLFLLFFYLASAQKNSWKIPDSLKEKNYEYLDSRFYALKKDSASAALYAFAYLYKAQNEKNCKEIIGGYQNLALISPAKQRLMYADSMIYAAKKSNDSRLIGGAYLSRGTVYYGMKKQQEALDNYLTANSYISKTNDQYLIHKVKYCIALTKFYIGFYGEAASLMQQCAGYYKSQQPRPYLNSLHMLGLCYNKLGDYGRCSEINRLGIEESQRLGIKEMIPYFRHSEGINEYFKKNYGASIRNIESSLEAIKENNDFGNEAVGYFYIGKSYWSLGQKAKAAGYFALVDKIFNEKKYLRPDLRQAFELLISYSKSAKDLNRQSYYIDQLLKADTLLTENSRYILGKIHKQYDTKELLSEKEKIAAENKTIRQKLSWKKEHERIFIACTILMSISIIALICRHYRLRNIYKKNYRLLMQELDAKKNSSKIKTDTVPLKNISIETASLLLKQLENFENKKRFLEKDWKLGSLAADFNTNAKYLANILEHYRHKGINEYINGLRIDYIIPLLQTESKLKYYTYAALAQEAGFSTTERFTKAFMAKTGIAPSYFIGQLKKEKP